MSEAGDREHGPPGCSLGFPRRLASWGGLLHLLRRNVRGPERLRTSGSASCGAGGITSESPLRLHLNPIRFPRHFPLPLFLSEIWTHEASLAETGRCRPSWQSGQGGDAATGHKLWVTK